jgi:hypothetical protein
MIFSTIFVLLIIFGIGLPLVLLLIPRQNVATTLGISYPLGMGLFTFIMFLTNIAGLRFSLLNELVLLILVAAPLTLFKKREIKNFFDKVVDTFKNLQLSSVEKVILGVLAFVIVSSFLNTFYWPVSLWDSIVLYDFRAHIFASSGYMNTAFIDNYYINYPLLTSLGHTVVYLTGGKYPQFLHSLFYLSLGVSIYGFLREFVSRKLGLLSILVLLITQPIFYHSLVSYTNLAFTVYLSLGAICVYLWDKKKQTGYLILSALLISLSTWTRSVEPFWLAILLVVTLVSIYRKKIWNIAIFSLFFFPMQQLWQSFQSFLNSRLVSAVAESAAYSNIFSSLFDMERWGRVVDYLYKNVAIPWGAIFAAFILATISVFILKEQRKLFLIFFITYVLLASLFAGTVELSITTEYWYRIGDAAQRLSTIYYPLFVYCIALAIQGFVKVKQGTKY